MLRDLALLEAIVDIPLLLLMVAEAVEIIIIQQTTLNQEARVAALVLEVPVVVAQEQ
jgi:hypothetical protein